MMTACDVASVCKPWETQYKITHLVMSEFFDQGDGKHELKKEMAVIIGHQLPRFIHISTYNYD